MVYLNSHSHIWSEGECGIIMLVPSTFWVTVYSMCVSLRSSNLYVMMIAMLIVIYIFHIH